MDSSDQPHFSSPILNTIWKTMPSAMERTVSVAPTIPAIAARAKVAAAENPDFVRCDQGQVVGILPEREVYYGPSSGLPEIRSAVARFWSLAYRLDGLPGIPEGGLGSQNVGIVSGATEGLAILLRLLSMGQSVGLQRLHWGNYRNLVAHAGGDPVVIDFFNSDGSLDIEGIAESIDTHSIRTLVLNFPANPTGDCLSDEELGKIAALARGKDLLLIADEVYNWIRYDGEPRTMLGFAPERTIVVGAASKEYLIPGARTAWIISVDETFADQWLPRLIRSTSSSPNVLGQELALDMLSDDVADLEAGRPPRTLAHVKAEIQKRRDLIVQELQKSGFEVVGRHNGSPAGGIALLARLPEGLEDDVRFIDTGIDSGKFSAIPGSSFGAPGCVRIGYAGMSLQSIERLGPCLQEVAASVRGS